MKAKATSSLLVGVALLFMLPVLYIIWKSFISIGDGEQVGFQVLHNGVSVKQYLQIVLTNKAYFFFFLNSIKLTVIIVILHTAVSVLAGYGLSIHRSKTAGALFIVYAVVMAVPIQITLIPNIILYKWIEDVFNIHMMSSRWAVILPMVFSTFGVVVMKLYFDRIPKEIIEAAKIDGATEWTLFAKIALPYARPAIGVVSLFVFFDAWNMLDRALVLLSKPDLYPLSLQLNVVYERFYNYFFAAAVIYSYPVFILVQGVQKAYRKVGSYE